MTKGVAKMTARHIPACKNTGSASANCAEAASFCAKSVLYIAKKVGVILVASTAVFDDIVLSGFRLICSSLYVTGDRAYMKI